MKISHGAIVHNAVTYVYAKFGDDRLWNEKALAAIANLITTTPTPKNYNNSNNVGGHWEPVSGSDKKFKTRIFEYSNIRVFDYSPGEKIEYCDNQSITDCCCQACYVAARCRPMFVSLSVCLAYSMLHDVTTAYTTRTWLSNVIKVVVRQAGLVSGWVTRSSVHRIIFNHSQPDQLKLTIIHPLGAESMNEWMKLRFLLRYGTSRHASQS